MTAGQSPPPLGLHLLLELLKELLVETGQRVGDPEARATLGRLSSSAKIGRLVRDLIALEAYALGETVPGSRAAVLDHVEA